jgi:hypothetical protein
MSEHNEQSSVTGDTLELDPTTSMPLPSGTASAGLVPVVIGTGYESASAMDPPPPGSGRGATIFVAARDTNDAGKAAADFVCTGTSTTGGDEVTINAAINAARRGRVVLLEGIYWRTNPISCDSDYTILEGQGPSTVIAVPTSGVSPSGYASIIFGNTRTLTGSSIRYLRVQPQGSGTSLVSGSGHGVAFRSNDGRLEDVTVQSCSGDGWRIGGCTNTSLQVTVTQAIGAPAPVTKETWSVSAVPAIHGLPAWAKVTTSSYTGTPGNDDSIETVAITAMGSNTVSVVRGWDSTPITAIASNAVLIPIDSVYENAGTTLNTIFPGGNGMVIEATVENSEFLRCVANGGMRLDPPRGANGIVAFGGINKLLACHAYFNPLSGLNVDCTGVGGMGAMQITGGEYETNGVGISMSNAYYMQVSGTKHYANVSESILLKYCDRTSLDGVNSLYNAGESSPTFQHVYADACQRTTISGGLYQHGDATAIVINGYSPGTSVHDNTIYGLDPSSPTANAIRLSGCYDVDVIDNIVDRSILEDTTPGGDFNRIWGNRILNTNNGMGVSLAGVTTNGAHTVAYHNLGQSDKVYSSGSTLTAVLRKTHLVSAPSGGTTVTLPGADAIAIPLASESQGVTLPQATLTLAAAPAYVPTNGGQVMVPVTGGTWTLVTYSAMSGAVLSGCLNGFGTTMTGNVYLLPPDGEEFSIVQINNSGTVTLEAPPGSLINGESSFPLTAQRAYRVMLCSGNWNAY